MKFVILMLLLIADIVHSLSISNLPQLLITNDNKTVTSSEMWQNVRKPEIIGWYYNQMFGKPSVERPADMKFELIDSVTAMGGTAIRKRIRIIFSGIGGRDTIPFWFFTPVTTEPVPAFLLISHRASSYIDYTRATKTEFWPAERIVERGYAAVVLPAYEVDQDVNNGFSNGVHVILDTPATPRPPYAWATISSWAWGASRIMDYLETDKCIDASKVAVVGHSRGGKTSLWCGVRDERFALTVVNESGCGGAQLFRYPNPKENIAYINNNNLHWFCENFKSYNSVSPNTLPVDQHMMIAMLAPRLVYVASATQDAYCDPEGEFLSCVYAKPVFSLYNIAALPDTAMPPANTPLADESSNIGYHLRTGIHDLLLYDWERFMDFADLKWRSDSIVSAKIITPRNSLISSGSLQLRTIIYFANGKVDSGSFGVSFLSLDTNIATVTKSGRVQALDTTGAVRIIAKRGAKFLNDTCYIQIVKTSISFLKRFDFRCSETAVRTGWISDSGRAYSLAAGYGWTGCTSTPESRCNRSGGDLLGTFIMISTAACTTATFKVDVPDGKYLTRIGLGDATYPNEAEWVLNGNDTVAYHKGSGYQGSGYTICDDTVTATGGTGLVFKVRGQVYAKISYLIILSNQGISIGDIADDNIGQVATEKKPDRKSNLTLLAGPNPFNPEVSITFDNAGSLNSRIDILSLDGKIIRTFANLPGVSTSQKIKWDGTNSSNIKVSAGIYMIRLKTGNVYKTAKVIFIQ
ncbi:MAG: T9SS type A sorting domain-containing protein [Fibrobacteres bacterium]|nr:T9SS type A sorting domain-containing protein [Fibrobacterota bacterium]